jgi:uncharacterized protein (DUF58 family)
MRARVVAKNRILGVLILCLLAAAIIDDYAGWRMLLIGLGLAWLIGRLWVGALAGGLRLEREMRFGWAQVGDRLEERFTLINDAPMPALWVELHDESTLPDYNINQVTGIEARTHRSWRAAGTCTRRGVFTLGPHTLTTGDPLGLFTVELTDPRSVQLLVTPPVLPLPEIQVAAGGKTGEGRPRAHSPERTVSVAGVRQYAPEDSLRWVHWPTSARRGELFVRTFDRTSTGDWWIVLDANCAVQAGSGQRATLEHAVILAASLADRGLKTGRGVGVAGLGKDLLWLGPQTGEGHRLAILRALATLDPGSSPLEFLLQRMEKPLSQARSLILITPDVSTGWLEALLPLVWRGAVPTVLLLDPITFGASNSAAPFAGELSRFGITHQIIPADLLDRPEARPGRVGRADWRVTPFGRAIPVEGAAKSAWKHLD